MNTLRRFLFDLPSVPTATAWYLGDLGDSRGRQHRFAQQAPERLEALREHAVIESAISSNRIEGVEIERDRVNPVLFGKQPLRDRNEEEIRGYRLALSWVHDHAPEIPVSEATILQLHRLVRGEIWDAGKYKETDADIIERCPDGRTRVRFSPVTAHDTPAFMAGLVDAWQQCINEEKIPPAVVMAAFNLDFLCIHPFRDGNGRVSRLLLLLQCYHFGYDVGRFISLERVIEENKERYYETLEESSRGWHESGHDPWPIINYLLFVLKSAYRELGRLETGA